MAGIDMDTLAYFALATIINAVPPEIMIFRLLAPLRGIKTYTFRPLVLWFICTPKFEIHAHRERSTLDTDKNLMIRHKAKYYLLFSSSPISLTKYKFSNDFHGQICLFDVDSADTLRGAQTLWNKQPIENTIRHEILKILK